MARRLRGLAVEGRRPPRAEQAVLVDGAEAGVVTSGNFSPILGHGIALAFLPPEVEEGAEVAIDVRGRGRARPGSSRPRSWPRGSVAHRRTGPGGRRMRRITMLAMVAVLALWARPAAVTTTTRAARTPRPPTTAATTDDGGDDDGGDDGGTDAATSGLVDEDCEFLLAGAYLNPLAAPQPGEPTDDFEETAEQLEAIADDAPDEIQDAMAHPGRGLRRDRRGLPGHRPLGPAELPGSRGAAEARGARRRRRRGVPGRPAQRSATGIEENCTAVAGDVAQPSPWAAAFSAFSWWCDCTAFITAAVAAFMNSGRFSAAQSRLAVVLSDERWNSGNT